MKTTDFRYTLTSHSFECISRFECEIRLMSKKSVFLICIVDSHTRYNFHLGSGIVIEVDKIKVYKLKNLVKPKRATLILKP